MFSKPLLDDDEKEEEEDKEQQEAANNEEKMDNKMTMSQLADEMTEAEQQSQTALDQLLNLGKKDANSSSPDRASSQAT